jgi:hypothetical protein
MEKLAGAMAGRPGGVGGDGRDGGGVWVHYRARTGALASLGTLIGSPEPAATA